MGTNKEKAKDLINRIDNITLDLIYSDLEFAKKFLQDEGIDSEEILKQGEKDIKLIQFLYRASQKKRRDQYLMTKAVKSVKSSFEQNADLTRELLLSLVSTKGFSVQFRNLDKWSDEEIKEILIDVDLVTLLEKLENE